MNNKTKKYSFYKDFKEQPGSLNYGERLYYQNMERQKKNKENLEKLKEEKQKEEEKENTFHPKIGKKSKQLAQRKPNVKIEDRLLALGKNQHEKKIKEMAENKINQKSKLTFKPTIPESSEIIGEIKRKNRLDELQNTFAQIPVLQHTVDKPKKISENHNDSREEYHSSEKQESFSFDGEGNNPEEIIKDDDENISIPLSTIQKQKTEEESSDFSMLNSNNLNPPNHISKQSRISYSSSKKDSRKSACEFHPDKNIHDFLYLEAKLKEKRKKNERDKIMAEICPFKPNITSDYKPQREEETTDQFFSRMAKAKEKPEEEIIINPKAPILDVKTGQVLFKPRISKGNFPSIPRNDKALKRQINEKEKKQREIQKSIKDKNRIFLDHSKEIIYRMKIDRFKEIFDSLDSDHDGFISSSKIQLSTLDHEILEGIIPLLKELQENGQEITFKEFCLEADKLINVQIFPPK